ncbi:hypothetical protein CONLIGDRAFT_201446 [Coniochaeta ligniaria NRRL 30616]|uniref:DRBM domain-containing protein n=1 Tax=Coniochaeta ligniaria NRRL 30616 TaxID=1408157 RepID=A0A1J7J389_9PEZI|nr:hypothetical protein CONLIGDRAFT_201446 [Coniochaeta ligniaria NRRL 30616]
MSDSAPQKVDYQALKAWIAAQEAYAAATGEPAPTTPAQRKAIAELSKSNPSPLTQNVTLGDMDSISILHHYVNATQAQGTTLTYSDPLPTPSPSSPPPLWTQTLVLTLSPSSPPLTFPSHKTGGLILLDAVGSRSAPPAFTRVRDAKKYAAQTAVSYLASLGKLVPSPATGTLAPPSPPARRGVPTSGGGGGAVDARDDSIPATQRVAELCRRLGLQAPSYELVPAAGAAAGAGVWDGEADFGRDRWSVPDGTGRVEGVYGKRNAKEGVAERVLVYLLGVEEERERTRRELEESEDEDDSEEF